MRIAFLQWDIGWEDPAFNRRYVELRLEERTRLPEVLVLPEMFSTGFTMNAARVAELPEGDTVTWMRQLAAYHQVILCGSVVIGETDGRYYNRFLWVEPKGKVRSYDKRHLFSLAGEHQVYTAGRRGAKICHDGWVIVPQICYDLRFPAFLRGLLPFDLMINVASWPQRRVIAWKVLLQARAIENQCYVIGVNRIGTDDVGLAYSGQSAVYGPDGRELLQAGDRDGWFETELSKDYLVQFRDELPFLRDRDTITFD